MKRLVVSTSVSGGLRNVCRPSGETVLQVLYDAGERVVASVADRPEIESTVFKELWLEILGRVKRSAGSVPEEANHLGLEERLWSRESVIQELISVLRPSAPDLATAATSPSVGACQ